MCVYVNIYFVCACVYMYMCVYRERGKLFKQLKSTWKNI